MGTPPQSVEQEQLEKKMAYRSGSSASGGSRYPSAYGHTPSYRSYNSLGGTSTSYDLPSSSSSSAFKSDLARELARDHKTTSFGDDKFFSDVSTAFDTPLASSGTSGSSSSKKVSS